MKSFLRNRIVQASLLFTGLELVGGLLIAAPFLVFLRIHFEKSGAALMLWPIIAPQLITDILVNHQQALIVFFVAATVIYSAFFPLKILVTGGIYSLIVTPPAHGIATESPRAFFVKAVGVWSGFVKISLLAIAIYLVSFFLGITIGNLLGRLGLFWKALVLGFFLLLASTYLQVLKISIVKTDDGHLRAAIFRTRKAVASSLSRLVIGNLSVTIFALILLLALWSLLRWIRGFEWGLLTAAISIVVQQGMAFLVCLAQSVRINFNHSVISRGD